MIQPYNMLFKRVLHLTAQRIYELGEQLAIRDDIREKVWIIMKVLLSVET
jgi:hypothetical protein